MNKTVKITLIIIGTLLLLNGVLNIIDDARVLTYDIASILSGMGFVTISLFSKK
jgi:ABC-type transport system involved in multi-copper enzyme maturation permease subunit